MSPSVSKYVVLTRPVLVVFSIALSLWVGFMAQASSPNYLRLFLSLLPVAALNALLVALVVSSKAGRVTWLVAIPGFLGFASYFEMGCRIVLGFRSI
jgi:hypothetical protein